MERVQSGAPYVARNYATKILLIDDETYVPADPLEVPDRKFYHNANPVEVRYNDKFRQKSKCFKKYLVWQALDQFGNVSEPYICEGTINTAAYLKECIIKRLIPCINNYHKNNLVLLWSDLATVH